MLFFFMFTIACCVFFLSLFFFFFSLLCVFCYLLPSWRSKVYIYSILLTDVTKADIALEIERI